MDQTNEYQEFRNQGFKKFIKKYEDNDDKGDIKDDNEGYRDWCNHSKTRWAQNKDGSQTKIKEEWVITQDMEEKSEERLYEGEVSPTRIASFKSHCCGRNNFVDLDKTLPLDDIKSNCHCDGSSRLRIKAPYQINNRSRLREYWPDQD